MSFFKCYVCIVLLMLNLKPIQSDEFGSKRLLLANADSSELVKDIAQLKTTVKLQTDAIQQLQTEYQQSLSKQSALETEIQNQATKLQHQADLISHLTTENRQLSSSLSLLTSENQHVLNEIQQIQQTIQTQVQQPINIGATYVRWGRKQCPQPDTELVYSGYAGGGKYDERGSAAEYVCLPPDPDFNRTNGGDRGRIYGAEYNSNFFGDIHSGSRDVPCAVCRTTKTSSVIMIPGKNRCYTGWKTEYYGFLASNDHAWVAAGSYACVDKEIEFTSNDYITDVTQYGKLFLEVVAKCGSLHCPPYKNNVPLTCVVCSK